MLRVTLLITQGLLLGSSQWLTAYTSRQRFISYVVGSFVTTLVFVFLEPRPKVWYLECNGRFAQWEVAIYEPWTDDWGKALHFADRQSAEQFAAEMPDHWPVRVLSR